MALKVLSLFDGISCGRVALERAGIDVAQYVAYEIDPYAVQISKKNYPDIVQCGDVTTADYTHYKGYDFLMGGSPCTFWSISKKNRETTPDGMGAQLFLHFVRAWKESGCKYFLYENNYSIHEDIKAFISNQLGVELITINSALLSAQQRKRCYWTNIPNVEQPADKGITLQQVIDAATIPPYTIYNEQVTWKDCTKTAGSGTGKTIRIGQIGKGGQGQRVYSVLGKSVTLAANGGGAGAKTGLYKIDRPNGGYIVRKLTPIEAERLQTLPDNYTEGIPDEQRYKCVGNGWTVDVIAHILKNLKQE